MNHLSGSANSKCQFSKPPISFNQQVNLLESRGLIIADKDRVESYLTHINYYRFAAYCLPFEEDHATHRFKTATTFENILDIYVFDRELR